MSESEVRYSEDLNTALAAAQHAAWERNHNRVAPLHMLYGLMEAENVVSLLILRLIEGPYCLIEVLGLIDHALGTGSHVGQTSNLPFTLKADKALSFAQNKALTEGLTEIGCDHLLLGIYHADTEATGLLQRINVPLVRFKKELRSLLIL